MRVGWNVAVVGGLALLLGTALGAALAGLFGAGSETVVAVASTVSAIGTIAAVGTLYFAAREFKRRELEHSEQRSRDRMAQEPYLRVDIAFSEPEAREKNLRLPEALYVYGAEELGIADELASIREAVGPRSESDPVFHLSLYVTNLQQQPLGIADQVEIGIRAVWNLDDPQRGSQAFPVSLAYLAPQQTTAVELMAVRQDLGMLLVFVEELSYRDLLRDTVRDAHGAMQMYYTWDEEHEHAVIWNERGVQRGETL